MARFAFQLMAIAVLCGTSAGLHPSVPTSRPMPEDQDTIMQAGGQEAGCGDINVRVTWVIDVRVTVGLGRSAHAADEVGRARKNIKPLS